MFIINHTKFLAVAMLLYKSANNMWVPDVPHPYEYWIYLIFLSLVIILSNIGFWFYIYLITNDAEIFSQVHHAYLCILFELFKFFVYFLFFFFLSIFIGLFYSLLWLRNAHYIFCVKILSETCIIIMPCHYGWPIDYYKHLLTNKNS